MIVKLCNISALSCFEMRNFPPLFPYFAHYTQVKSESEVAQSCPTLSDPMDCSPPGSSVHGILQARILEWFAISFSRVSALPRDGTCILHWQADPLPLSHQFSSVMSDSLRPHELQHARPPCPSPTPGVHPNPCPLSQ